MPRHRASSPDPLQDLDGPSIYRGGTPVSRPLKRTTTTTIVSPRKNKKLSHTTVVSTPKRSPWRIRVVVEAERDSGGSEVEEVEEVDEKPLKRARTSRVKTTKVPLRGLSPVPDATASVTVDEKRNSMKRKTTPVRRRRRSTTATPGGPGKTPAKKGKSVTPVVEEQEEGDTIELKPPISVEKEIDEGIGPSEYGFGDEVATVPTKHNQPKATPRKPPAKRTPAKRTPAKRRTTPAIASSSKAPPALPPPQEEDAPPSPRSALSSVSTNRLSPTPSPRKRSPAKPRGFLTSSHGSGDDDMEGFSMVDTNSLLPDFLNSLSHPRPETIVEEEGSVQGNMLENSDFDNEDLPDFTFVSHGTSYTPHTHKKHGPPPAEPEPLFEDDPVGAETFYGKTDFRSSPPALFQRAKVTPVLKPLTTLPEPAKRKRRRSVPELGDAVAASEGLRSSMGLEEMTMTGEPFGGVLDDEEEVRDEYAELQEQESDSDADYPNLPEEPVEYPRLDKGQGIAISSPPPQKTASMEPPQELKDWAPSSPAPPESEINWAPSSPAPPDESNWAPSSPSPPPKSPEKSVRFVGHEDSRNSPSTFETSRTRILEAAWAAEREAVSRKAKEVGTLTINSDEAEEDTLEAERIIEDIWQAEAEPRSDNSPVRGRAKAPESSPVRAGEREEMKLRTREVGAVTIGDTIEEEEEEGPTGTTTLMSQDTAAFEESLFEREKQQTQPTTGASLFTSSSTPYKRGSSSSSRETYTSRSSPPQVGRWRGTRKTTVAKSPIVTSRTPVMSTSTTPTRMTPTKTTPAKDKITTPMKAKAATPTKTATTANGKEKAKPPRKTRRNVVEMEEVAEEVDQEGSINMLTEELLTPPLDIPISTGNPTPPLSRIPTPPASFTGPLSTTSVPAPRPIPVPRQPTRPTRPTRAARSSRTTSKLAPAASAQPRVGPIWEKRHWKLLDRLLHSSSTVPPPNSRLTYLVSIDDPSALDTDPDALLSDPALTVTTMPTGEKALVLGGKEVEAVKRFMERMQAEGGEVEKGWGVEMVAGKVGALMVAEVRRRRREESSKVRERGVGRGHGGGIGEERGRAGRMEEKVVGRERQKEKGKRLSDWL